MGDATNLPQQDADVVVKSKKQVGKRPVSSTTLFFLSALMLLVGFAVGTRSDQLFAAIAPIFGVKASADTLDTRVLQETFRNLKANYDGELDLDALADGAARGMVEAAGDRYTSFLSSEEAAQLAQDLNGQVSGIGCEIGVRNDQPTVLRVLTDSPAEKSGIKVGDVFIAVNSESVVGADSSTTASKIRGEAGTSVKITVKRASEVMDFTITRATVSDPSVRYSVSDGLGVMILSRFDSDTAQLAREAALEFKRQNVRGVILDLRDNGGGYLDAARDVAGIWLKDQIVVKEQSAGKITKELKSGSSAILEGVQTVVLVNGGSASASEIVAGALQDHGVAKLLGEKTFGKGTVQNLLSLSGGRQLKVTVARWLTPKGKNITKEGISPDIKVQLTSDDTNHGFDPQLEAAKARF